MECPFLVDNPDQAQSILSSCCHKPDVIRKAFDSSYEDLFGSITNILLAIENRDSVQHMGIFFDSEVFYHVRYDLAKALDVFQASPSDGYSGQLFEHPFFAHSSLPEEMIFVVGKGDEKKYVGYGSFKPDHNLTLGEDRTVWNTNPFFGI